MPRGGGRLRSVLSAWIGVPIPAEGHRRRDGPHGRGAHGSHTAQVGLAWLLAHDNAILLIPGTSRLEHLEENVAIGDLTLSTDDVAELDNAGS